MVIVTYNMGFKHYSVGKEFEISHDTIQGTKAIFKYQHLKKKNLEKIF